MLLLEHTCPCLRAAMVVYLLCTKGRVQFLFISLSSVLSPESSTVPGTQDVQNKHMFDE